MQSGADRTMQTGRELELETYLMATKAGIGTATRDEMDDCRRPVDEKGNVNEHKHGIVCMLYHILIFIKVFGKKRVRADKSRTITANRILPLPVRDRAVGRP